MDIQGYIVEHWLGKTSDTYPLLTIYDPTGFYEPLLAIAEAKGIMVFNTKKDRLQVRLDACDAWMKLMSKPTSERMLIYRPYAMPSSNNDKVQDPYSSLSQTGEVFPNGPTDNYMSMCKAFLPNKKAELDKLYDENNATFDNVNALLEGASYPALENLTGGKSPNEMTIGILSLRSCSSTGWMQEWKQLASRHYPGLDCSGSALEEIQKKLWQYILFSEFALDFPEDLPSSLTTVSRAKKENEEIIFNLCRKIRNQIDLRDDYIRYAEQIASELRLADLFSGKEDLGNIVTFAFENAVEYVRYIKSINSADIETASKILNTNIGSIWYQANPRVEAFWKLAFQMQRLMTCSIKGIPQDNDIQTLVKWYSESGWEADAAFRTFRTIEQQLEYTDTHIKELSQMMDSRYREFTSREVDAWQKSIEINGLSSCKNRVIGAYDKYIKPDIKSGKKVVMIMADAFRYEMAVDFAMRMTHAKSIEDLKENSLITCTPTISVVPSVTRFGMAALMPGAAKAYEMKTCSGKLEPVINGNICSLVDQRVDIIRNEIGNTALYETQIKDFNTTEIGPNTKLIVVRSLAIDAAGESNSISGFQTMNSETKRFARVIEECKQFGFNTVYIFADHGFMMQPSFLPGDNLSKPVGTTVLEERRCLAGKLAKPDNVISLTPEQIGVKADFDNIVFARGFAVFEKGKTYFHEGLSMQENIIPIVKIDISEPEKNVHFSLSMKYKGEEDAIIYIRRPKIDFSLAFDDLFGEEVKLKIIIADENGNIVGSPKESAFYNDTTQIMTIPDGTTSLGQFIEVFEDFNGKFTVTALDPSTNATLAILKLETDIDC